ncbi:MAG: hypothetical protein LIO71_03535 [Ruminococcus sp.]|nr:hypothetical protein [Ruminococcus sp.]
MMNLDLTQYSKEKQQEIQSLVFIPIGRAKDLTGQKFGRLTALGRAPRDFRGAYWWCICDCLEHNIIQVSASHLTCGQTKSCGCLNKEIVSKIGQRTKKDIVGQKFGHLTVIKDSGLRAHNRGIIWTCQCDCGNIINVRGDQLKSGEYVSCGCQKESFGEEKIKTILTENNIIFIQQYFIKDFHIDNDPHSHPKFDFYLPDYNCIIEYDGEQHFKIIEHWGGEEGFKQSQRRDQIKNQYCKEHNIKLKRIPYYDIDKISIETLMDETFTI